MILFFKPMLWSRRRFRRLPKSGGPTLLAFSLEVQRDSIHDPPPGLRSLLLRVLNARRALKVPGSAISGWRLVSCPNGNRAARRRRDCRTTTHAHLASRRRRFSAGARSFARPVRLWVSIGLTPFSSRPEVVTVGQLGARLTVFIWNVDFLECLTIDHKPYHAGNQQQYACQDQPVR